MNRYYKPLIVFYPELAKELHLTKNKDIFKIGCSLNRKVWWRCLRNFEHEWQQSVKDRVYTKNECPFCRKIPVFSDSLSAKFPLLCEEWHPFKNGKLTPDQVYSSYRGKVWWRCARNPEHEWEIDVTSRSFKKGLCPICLNRKLNESNSLGILYPELIKEWHPTKNGILTPFDFRPGSNKKVWWKCPVGNDHQWETAILHRAKSGTKCPFCARQKPSISNCLGSLYPELIKEFNFIKNDFTPFDILPGSDRKIWWICKDKHEWIARVANRTNLKRGCPFCKESRGEKRIKQIFKDLKLNYEQQKKFQTCRNQLELPFDFYVDNKFLLEYQGKQHFEPLVRSSKITKEKKEKALDDFEKLQINDEIKRNWCKANNISLLEICYLDFKNIEKIIVDYYVNL